MDVLASYGSDSEDDEIKKEKVEVEEATSDETKAHLSSDFSMRDLKSKHQLQIAPIVEDKKVKI